MSIERELSIDLDRIVAVVDIAARAGAGELMKFYGVASIREKGPRDLVTEADVASQNAIQRIVTEHFPDHLFVGEEDGSATAGNCEPMTIEQLAATGRDEVCWVVDPLDGTTNYAHGMNAFAVSIAVIQSGVVLAGAIYDPTSGEMFAAAKQRGATLNGEPIQSSKCVDLNEALIAASFPANVVAGSPEIERFILMLERCQAIRRLGSAALNLCYVAAGRLDGYWATSVKTWDVAAGYLIANEAGATLTQIDGGEFNIWNPRFIAAGNLNLLAEMQPVLAVADETD